MPEKLEEIHKSVAEKLKGKTNPRTKKPYTDEDIWAIANAQYQKSEKEVKYFCNQKLSFKEEGDDFYLTFLLATDHPDNAEDDTIGVVGDIIPKSTLESMAGQWNSSTEARKGSIHHKRGFEIPSIGQPGAKVISLPDGHNGVLCTAKVNKHFNDLDVTGYTKEKLIDEIKDSILDGVSIEYKANNSKIVEHEGKNYRLLEDVSLYGYGHASRPTNGHSRVLEYGFKELNLEVKELENKDITFTEVGDFETKGKKTTEEKTMSEEKENKEKAPETKFEVSEAEYKEFVSTKRSREEKEEVEKKEKLIKELVEVQVKELIKDKLPLVQSGNHFIEAKEELPALMEYKESLRLGSIADQWSAANRLVDAIGLDNLRDRSQSKELTALSGKQNFECKGSKIVPRTMEVKEIAKIRGMEFKALTTTTNAEATYYQAAAELQDIYGPVVFNQLNDRTLFLGVLPKENFSDKAKIQFLMETVKNASTTGYLESASTFTEGQETNIKCENGWAMYHTIIKVSGLMMAESMGAGGTIGDAYGHLVQRGAVALQKKINQDLLTGAAATYNGSATDALLGLQHLCQTTGNLYGKARSSVAALQGQTEAMSSAELSLKQLRKMIRSVVSGNADARLGDLLFVMPFLQKDKFLQILQSQNVQPTLSGRAGFTGALEFDGVVLLPEPDADSDDVFLVDLGNTKLGIKVAPRLEDVSVGDYDGRKSHIKTYFNMYSTKPKNNYWSSGFSTA